MVEQQNQNLMFNCNSISFSKSVMSITTPSPPESVKYTIEKAINSIGIGLYQIPIFIVIGCLYAVNSAEIMILSFLLPITEDEWNLQHGIQSIIAGVVFLGIVLSAPFWAYLVNKYKRKNILIFCTLGQNIIGISTAFANNIYWMVFLKFIVGLFLGASLIYFKIVAEYLPPSFRGKLLLFQICCWSIGSTFNALLAWICIEIIEILNWRWYIVLSYAIPLCILSFFLYFMDESSVYLLSKGDVNSAKNVLIKAAKRNQKALPNGSLSESKIMMHHIAFLSDWHHIFHSNYGAIYATSITLYIISFLCGFCYYGICFFSVQLLHEYSIDIYLKMAIIASGEFLSVFTWISLENCRRKCAFVVHCALYLYSICTLMFSSIQKNVKWVIIFLFIGRMGIFSAFLIVNVYMNEYYKTNLRNTAMMIEIWIAAIGGIITSVVSQRGDIIDIQWTLYMYGLMGIVTVIAALRLRQDTKNDIIPTRMPLITRSSRMASSKQLFNKDRGIYEWHKIETKQQPVFERGYSNLNSEE